MPTHDVDSQAIFEAYLENIQTFKLDDGNIKEVATNSYSNAILMENGTLYMWGRNGVPGMLCGPYISIYDTLIPRDITSAFSLNEGEQIIEVFLGLNDNYVFTNQSRLFEWGGCNDCNLGACDVEDRGYPKDVTFKMSLAEREEITSFNWYNGQMLILTSEQNVLVWGSNSQGQLGNGTRTSSDIAINIATFFELNINESIEKVSLSNTHSAAITNEGRLFMWGWNSSGELGDGTNDYSLVPLDITENIPLDNAETIIEVGLGFHMTTILTSIGRVFTFGSNGFGQLGNNSDVASNIPIDITSGFNLDIDEKIIKLIIEGVTCLAITDKGNLYGWGNNESSLLGINTENNVLAPINITEEMNFEEETYLQITIGNEYIIIITEDEVLISGNKTFDLVIDYTQ